jgi:hypothetical protein
MNISQSTLTFLTDKKSAAVQDFTRHLNEGKSETLQAEMGSDGVGIHCKLLFWGIGAANKKSNVARKEVMPLSAINIKTLTEDALEMVQKPNGDVYFKNPSKKLKLFDGESIPEELGALYTGANASGLYNSIFDEIQEESMPVAFVME